VSMAQAAARIDPSLAEAAGRLGEAFAAGDAQELLVDYTRLFSADRRAGTALRFVWLEDGSSLMRESTVAVNALYDEGDSNSPRTSAIFPTTSRPSSSSSTCCCSAARGREKRRSGGGRALRTVAAAIPR